MFVAHKRAAPLHGLDQVGIRQCLVRSDYTCIADTVVLSQAFCTWQIVSGLVVVAVGEGVTDYFVGDRIALNTASPCGKCSICAPVPYGSGRPDLCRTPITYWGGPQMGFGDYIVSPAACASKIPNDMTFDVASLAEPMGVSIDLVETGEVRAGDNVLIIGPGPLGLGAVTASLRAGAAHVALAGLSGSLARMESGKALGANELIEVDKANIVEYYSSRPAPNKILVTAPPQCLKDAFEIAPFGATIAYIGIAWGPGAMVEFDADTFHFKKLSLKASFASPDTQLKKAIRLLETAPELGRELISHRFKLDDIADAMTMCRDDRERTVKKMIMVSE